MNNIVHSDHIQDLFDDDHEFDNYRPNLNITVRVNPSGKSIVCLFT